MKPTMKFLLSIPCIALWLATANAQQFEIYVSDAGNFSNPPWKILRFDDNGENPQVFIETNLAWPQDIVFLDGTNTVLVSNLNSGRITRYNAETGAYIDDFASGIGGPTRMKIGTDNRLYVLQWTGNGRVWRYELDGTFVDEFTAAGVPQSIGLDWDSNGNLYVASFNRANVQKFDSSGSDLGSFISSNLLGPTNIWFDGNGDLLVSDYSGNSIKRFDSNGSFLSTFIQGLANSEGVDFFPDGNILIGNGGSSSVRMYAADGSFIEDLVASGSGGLQTPNAVVIRDLGAASGFQINAGLNDAWFNRSTSGQGFFIAVFPNLEVMSLAWFTFDTSLPDSSATANLGWPGHRWFTATGPYTGDTATLDITFTTGGVFDSTDPSPSNAPGGTITVKFTDCENATVSYDIPSVGRTGTVPLTRVAPDNVTLCTALSDGS